MYEKVLPYQFVHGEVEADKALSASQALFSGGSDYSYIPATEILSGQLIDGTISVVDLMMICGLASSKSDCRRLIQQGGLFIDNNNVDSIDYIIINSDQLNSGILIRKEKKSYHKVFTK